MPLTSNTAPRDLSGTNSVSPVPFQVVSADGAITLANGIVFITKVGVAVITLDTPPAGEICELTIVSETASAHTITHTLGFGGGTTTRDVATFGGAISDGMVIVGRNGVWFVSSTRNVTIA